MCLCRQGRAGVLSVGGVRVGWVKMQKEAAVGVGGLHPTPQAHCCPKAPACTHLNDSTPDRPSVSEKASSSRGKAGGCSGLVLVLGPRAAGALMLGAVR